MTYREYIELTLKQFNVTSDDVSLILVNQSAAIPSPEDDVNPIIAQRAICMEIGIYLPKANVSEGGFSLSWNMDAIKMWYEATCAKIGIQPTTKPRIRVRRNIW